MKIIQRKKMVEEQEKLPLSELTAITILDGRNRRDVVELASHVSEYNIIRTRLEVEGKYLIALSRIGVIRPLKVEERKRLESFGGDLSLEDAKKVKQIEDETQHDVKAMERSFRTALTGTSLEDVIEKVHFGLTSEDVNNLTYRLILHRATHHVMIPALDRLTDGIVQIAEETKGMPMLARTHGQAAVPTTTGKEMIVFGSRLNREVRALEKRPLRGKLTGAVGNLNALKAAYSNINWISFSEEFVRSFGFEANLITTQIDPYEDMIEYFQNYKRINGVVLDLDQDMWRYISDDWFVQEVREEEVGSSTMPQKVNPIRFENSEGNLGKADAFFEYLSKKLAVSRLQRDLSDSTVIRDLGVPLGWSLLAYKNAATQLGRVRPDEAVIDSALNKDWSILGEAAQTIMRREDIEDPYSIMANLTRGKHIGEQEWLELVDNLPLNEKAKDELKNLTPHKYIGEAVRLTELAIKNIKDSRR